ncbi:hypothetical protein H6501_06130 [Candidatus Woesearchaeota archaeon]|nr:hypothetical protein [Nanoarchaeota archaeon]MCB9371152.1 hypothetical protein [Candidatus Woesearchaeota archaeon]USN43853.1 MAG: hypothetical protein H6500_05690 [Candidatus Woesearchaeota archaeon]
MGDKKIFERFEAELVHQAKGYVRDRVTKKLIQIGEVSLAFFMAFLLLVLGLAQILGTYVSFLSGGWNYLLLGACFLLVGLVLK